MHEDHCTGNARDTNNNGFIDKKNNCYVQQMLCMVFCILQQKSLYTEQQNFVLFCSQAHTEILVTNVLPEITFLKKPKSGWYLWGYSIQTSHNIDLYYIWGSR